MLLTWVKVERQDGEGVGAEVFVGGEYEYPVGFIGTPLRIEAGEHTFETLGPDMKPNWRALQDIELSETDNSEDDAILVILQPAGSEIQE